MSHIPNRPILFFPAGLEITPAGIIKAPTAVLIMAAEERDEEVPPTGAASARPGLVKCSAKVTHLRVVRSA